MSEPVSKSPSAAESRPALAFDGKNRVALLAAFTIIALLIIAPAISGPFLSDDIPTILDNPYLHTLSVENLWAILDPAGAPAFNTHNYAPLHLLSHALEWSVFGDDTTGYHVVNALVHATTAALLTSLLVARGLPMFGAVALGLLFLVHPANVETTAWIYQLKTLAAAALGLGALAVHPRRPAVAAILFVAALAMKASAAAFLAPACVWTFFDRNAAGAWWRRRAWLLCWVAAFSLYALVQAEAYARSAGTDPPLHADPLVNARTIVAIFARYAAMAATSWGTSALHDPPRALDMTDPWWLVGVAISVLLIARIGWALKARREEAGWWLLAAAAYAPTSQVIPFLIPMADHYLYFPLLGLLGAGGFALEAPVRRLWARPRMPVAVGGALLVVAVGFAIESHGRARIWRSSVTLALDSASQYPNGLAAHLLRANRAGREGDVDATVRELRGALSRGYDRFIEVDQSSSYAAVRHAPAFRQVVAELAGAWLELSMTLEEPTQEELYMRSQAHLTRGELSEAIIAVELALARGGPFDPTLRAMLSELRRVERESGGPPDSGTDG